MNQYYILLIVGILALSIASVSILVYFKTNEENKPSLILNWIPTSLKPINQTEATSLITSTEEYPNKTIIHLANGLDFLSNDTSLKSGDVIYIKIQKYSPICSLSLNTNNDTLNNGTSFILKIIKDTRCNQGYQLAQLIDWHKLNQK